MVSLSSGLGVCLSADRFYCIVISRAINIWVPLKDHLLKKNKIFQTRTETTNPSLWGSKSGLLPTRAPHPTAAQFREGNRKKKFMQQTLARWVRTTDTLVGWGCWLPNEPKVEGWENRERQMGQETWRQTGWDCWGQKWLTEGKHFLKMSNKNNFYFYQFPTVYISHMILFNLHNLMRWNY